MGIETGAVLGFVARDERERVLGVLADMSVERGLEHVTLEDLAAGADVPLDTVRRYFDTIGDCALAAEDASSEQCFAAAAEAFMSTPGDCPMAARATLEAILHYMANSPSFIHLSVVETPRLGQRARAHRDRHMRLFAEFLGPGFAAAADMPPPPELVSKLIAGGVFELLSRYYHEGKLEQLPEALPGITYLAVATFFGIDEAHRVSTLPGTARAQ